MQKGVKYGSDMSSKQLARTVIDGRMLAFHLSTGDEINGYLCGMDDYHWLIVTTDGGQHLIHKGSATRIEIFLTPTYAEKHKKPELEKVISPFRRFVEENYLVRKDKEETS